MFQFDLKTSLSSYDQGIVVGQYISVQAATLLSGYNEQYLRRLLRVGKLQGIKIGQIWLIQLGSLDEYLQNAKNSFDNRHGPKGHESV